MKPLLCPQCGAPLSAGDLRCEYCGTGIAWNSDECDVEVAAVLYADDQPVEVIIRPSADTLAAAADRLAAAMAASTISADQAADALRRFAECRKEEANER